MTPPGKLRLLKDEGPTQFIQLARDAQQAKRDRRLIERTLDPSAVGSSISDDGIYPGFCQLASQDEQVFKRFRRSLIYRPVLDHVTREQGVAYLREIEQGGRSLEEFRTLVDSDSIGSPIKYDFPPYGRVSPTTLRYLKVATELADRFGPLDDMRVAEIGVGYGGQCRVLCALWMIKAYSLFDLPVDVRVIPQPNVQVIHHWAPAILSTPSHLLAPVGGHR